MQADARLSALQLSMVNTFCWKEKKEAVKPVSPELLDPETNPEGCTDLLSLVKMPSDHRVSKPNAVCTQAGLRKAVKPFYTLSHVSSQLTMISLSFCSIKPSSDSNLSLAALILGFDMLPKTST